MDALVLAQWAQLLLTWIGFGTLVGLLAKAIMPGRDPGGALATVLLGIVGSLVGAGLLAYFSGGVHVSPISILGFIVALGGTSLLLFMYRLLNGQGFKNVLAGLKARRGRRRIVVEEK